MMRHFPDRPLRNLIGESFPKLEIVGEAEDIIEGIDAINSLKPDLVFLDVHLKSGTGFDLLQEIRKH